MMFWMADGSAWAGCCCRMCFTSSATSSISNEKNSVSALK